MVLSEELKTLLLNEIKFSASKSSGPGGQNVNKVNSKVELRFSIQTSDYIGETEKNLLLSKLKTRINSEGEIVLFAQSERSQIRNKELVTLRFFELIEKALTPVKRRKKTQPSKASKLKRLESKKHVSGIKRLRRPPEL